jgi:hypothetical protein
MTDLSALPVPARRKFEALTARLDDAHALLAAIRERRGTYTTRLAAAQMALEAFGPPGRRDEVKARKHAAAIAEIEADLRLLDADRMRRQAERDAVERTLAPLRNFLASLWQAPDPYRAGGTALRSVVVEPELEDGETVIQAIERVRREIYATRAGLAQLKSAPLTSAELREKIAAEIDRLAVAGVPRINLQTGALEWIDTAPAHTWGTPSAAARSLLCWLFRDRVVEVCTADLDQEIPGAVSAAERPEREAQLRDELLRLERIEVALVDRGVAAGLDVHYRADCDPRAVLQIAIAAPEVEEVAA